MTVVCTEYGQLQARPRVMVLERVDARGGGSTSAALRAALPYDVAACDWPAHAAEPLTGASVDCIVLDADTAEVAVEQCRRVHGVSAGRDIPLVATLGELDDVGTIRVLDAGADEVVARSCNVDVLGAKVRALIRRHRSERMRSDQAHAALREELVRRSTALDAISYAVSHDLSAPLRGIEGFSAAVMDQWEHDLAPKAMDYLGRVRVAATRMAALIDALLDLTRVGRVEMVRTEVDVSALARSVAEDVGRKYNTRRVMLEVQPGLTAQADRRLMQRVFELLLDNCWKFTAKVEDPAVQVGTESWEGGLAYFVRDNGAGFDMEHGRKLGRPFQRLHTPAEFPGIGIGLAIVLRIIERHGGRLSVEGAVGAGATVRFTLPQIDRFGRGW